MDPLEIDLTGGAAAAAGDDAIELDASMLDLPERATLQPDGSVLLEFYYPRTLRSKRPGEGVQETEYRELVLHRLTGAEMRKVLDAPDSRASQTAAALCMRMRGADAALLMNRMDAADFHALSRVVALLIGTHGSGLPDQAELRDGAYVLPLREAVNGEFGVVQELVFHRLTGADLIEIGRAKETLPTAIARSTKIKLAAVQTMFDEMDAADIMAASRVIGFLSRNGLATGR